MTTIRYRHWRTSFNDGPSVAGTKISFSAEKSYPACFGPSLWWSRNSCSFCHQKSCILSFSDVEALSSPTRLVTSSWPLCTFPKCPSLYYLYFCHAVHPRVHLSSGLHCHQIHRPLESPHRSSGTVLPSFWVMSCTCSKIWSARSPKFLILANFALKSYSFCFDSVGRSSISATLAPCAAAPCRVWRKYVRKSWSFACAFVICCSWPMRSSSMIRFAMCSSLETWACCARASIVAWFAAPAHCLGFSSHLLQCFINPSVRLGDLFCTRNSIFPLLPYVHTSRGLHLRASPFVLLFGK